MRISIGHVTRHTYAEPTPYAIQSLRLTPPVFAGQRIIAWDINTAGIENALKFTDSFGNLAHLIVNATPHTETTIVARGIVETTDTAGIVQDLSEMMPTRVYLRSTPMTSPNDAITDLAHGISNKRDLATLHTLMNTVADRVAYAVDSTNVHTSAAEALADGRGVCQDHAHVFIAAARILGIPARYISGYFFTESEEPSEAHHAWAEAYVDDLGWVGFDPANRICPTERYVRLTTGLDAASAAPIRGTRLGRSKEELDVIVEVQQQINQQQ